jgi:methionyl-tRNA formyltransferase
MKAIFLGTPQLAVPSLTAVNRHHQVLLVATQPDRPRGRGRRLGGPPVKAKARELGIPCWQPENLDTAEARDRLGLPGADIIVVVAFGMKLPDPVLELTPHGAVNLHFSLLPAYRGAAPVNWAIIRGERETGVTTFRLTSRMDGGPVYMRRAVQIGRGETAGDLGTHMARVGADMLLDTLEGIEEGSMPPLSQDEKGASRAPKLKKEDGRIDWSLPAEDIVNLIHGVNPWPGAFTVLDGRMLKVWRAEHAALRSESASYPPGTVISASPRGELIVTAGKGTVSLAELQVEGKRRMAARDFLAGQRLTVGSTLH